ncbi:class I SAM-dependent methyltransferase [bacterium]|nr:class I SAM-dependent methyltransferase [bacterium]
MKVCKKTDLSFQNSGDFLNWWFERKVLDGKALQVFDRYYTNYRENFNGYLSQAWTNRHLELDKEIKALKDKAKVKIMDLGCGTGSVALYIAGKLGRKSEVLGIDINEDRLLCARERLKVLENEIGSNLNCTFKKENVLSINRGEKFDLIYLEETLHHMEPRCEIVKKIADLIKDEGVLIICEANAYNPFMQLHLFTKRGFKTIKNRVDRNGQAFLYGVERIMTPKRVVKLFGENGLHVKSLRYLRVASSKLGKLADKNNFSIMDVEKAICKIPFVRSIFSIHYNIVFIKS